MQETLVVVGAAVLRNGRVLAAQRARPEALRGRWEFPGGKARPGEAPEAALVRECREELGAHVRPLHQVGPDVPLTAVGPSAVLRLWTAELVEGDPRPLEHLALRWLSAGELHTVEWLPADLPFLAPVGAHLAPPAARSE
ncbi:(deoxy)nucleoside triphosphate pyrophosphohydrolase [Nocardiopsis sp. HNM0947]|uniref:8-oxo-dGTP diphosphatase n=1 Tax=Nocardiopsis coralli TaxID=2772213 RepID=A0ABR9P673_9ACTN|nr:(deoxy)nucleoside triphosphate pyrophosphohydrolase [Nocardiopsis coralli]MBE2999348.1 (deoxy)nucleoside triphosphate pyrophosphohydrolase [Nocardiopsis coralli]